MIEALCDRFSVFALSSSSQVIADCSLRQTHDLLVVVSRPCSTCQLRPLLYERKGCPHPTLVVYAGYPCSVTFVILSAFDGSSFFSMSNASSLVTASLQYRSAAALTNSSGVKSATIVPCQPRPKPSQISAYAPSFQIGLPRDLANMSHSALSTAPVASAMTPAFPDISLRSSAVRLLALTFFWANPAYGR